MSLNNIIHLLYRKNYKIIFLNYFKKFVFSNKFSINLFRLLFFRNKIDYQYKYIVDKKIYKIFVNTNDLRLANILFFNSQINKILFAKRAQEEFNLDYFFDFGGNYGEFSLVCSNFYKKVFYFEPNPLCVHYFKKTLKKECCNNVAVFNAAVVNTKTKFSFLELSDDTGSSEIKKKNSNKCIKVENFHAKKIFESINVKNTFFMKVDTEGSEGLIINDFIDFYKKKFKFIIMFENNLSKKNIKKLMNFINSNNLNFYCLEHYKNYLCSASKFMTGSSKGEYVLSNFDLKNYFY